MFEKLKNFGVKDIFKWLGIGLLGIIFIALFLGIISFIFSSISSNFMGGSRNLSNTASYQQKGMMSETMTSSSFWGVSDNGITPSSPTQYEIKQYSATIDSSKPESDCARLVSSLEGYKDDVKIENRTSSKDYCTISFKVIKGKEQSIIDIITADFRLRDIQSSIANIVKPYIETTDRIAELKKRLTEVDTLLESSKTQYDELWNALKNNNTSAASIDALNKIILNKSELISKFSKERSNLLDQIDALNKQKTDYDEQIKYVVFSAYFQKHVLFDLDQFKQQWFTDTQELVDTFNETIRNLSINLVDFLLKTFNVVVYIVLGAFFVLTGGKFLYHMGRRILLGKEQKKK